MKSTYSSLISKRAQNGNNRNNNHDMRLFYIISVFLVLVFIFLNSNNTNGDENYEINENDIIDEVYENMDYVYAYVDETNSVNIDDDSISTQPVNYFSLENLGDVWNTIVNFPRNFFQIFTDTNIEQMQFFLRDGFAFMESESEDVSLVSGWVPEESFVRHSQLSSVNQDEAGEIPTARTMGASDPLVYIFNSHPQELIGATFADLSVGEMSVVDFSYVMAAHFTNRGIPTLVEERNAADVLRENGWKFARSYDASRGFIEDRIHQYPSLQFFFDLHRDGIARELATAEIGGESYARVLFVIGGENPVGHDENYRMARTLHNMLEERRPGISRGVVVHSGPNVNGIYNQDIASTLQLFEIGTVESTVEESLNTIAILSDVLAEYIEEIAS